MKKTICYIVICLCLSPYLLAEQYTLEQCINTALQNNLQVRTQENDVQAQRLMYNQARQNLLPSVSGYASQSWSWGRSTGVDNISRTQNIANTGLGLNANIVLFDGLAMKYNIDKAKSQVDKSEATLNKIRLDISMNITAIYLQVLLNKELEQVAQQQLDDTHSKVERAQALVDADRLAQGELYTLQAQASKEENSLIQARNSTKLSLLDLAQAMELPFSDDFDITYSTLDFSLLAIPDNNEVYQKALNNRPEIKAAMYEIEAQKIALKSTKSAYSPVLSLGAGVNTGYYHLYGASNASFGKQLGDNLSTNVGLNLTIPVFDRMQTPNSVKRQELAVSGAQLQLEQAKQDLRKQIDQAYYNAVAAQSQQVSAEKALQSAREAFRYTEQKYEAGRSSTYEYFDAKQTLLKAQSEELQAKYNRIFKLKILNYYTAEDN